MADNKNSTQKNSFVGVDDGHYGIKLCFGKNKYVHIKSRGAYGAIQSISISGEMEEDNVYDVNDMPFTVADDIMIPDDKIIDPRSLYPSYPVSDLNCVFVYHALHKAGFSGKDTLSVVTGLPYLEFYKNGKQNTALIEAKCKNLDRIIVNANPNVTLPKIIKHNVLSEGMGAFLDLLFNWDGTQNSEIVNAVTKSPIAIVDIGGKTTDIVTVTGSRIDSSGSNTINLGALDFNNSISQKIKSKLTKLNNTVPEKVEEAIRTGVYVAFNKEHDVSDVVNQAKMMFARQIQEQILKTLKNAQDVGYVYFVGGGSIHLKESLQSLYGEQSRFPDDPEFANARGFFKAQFIREDWV